MISKLEFWSKQSTDKSLSAFDREMALAMALNIAGWQQITNYADTVINFPITADKADVMEWLRSHYHADNFKTALSDRQISELAYFVADKLVESTAPRMPLLCLACALDESKYLVFCQAVAIWKLYGKSLPKVVLEAIS